MDVKQFLQILSLDSPAKICSSITEMELPDEISSENCVWCFLSFNLYQLIIKIVFLPAFYLSPCPVSEFFFLQ